MRTILGFCSFFLLLTSACASSNGARTIASEPALHVGEDVKYCPALAGIYNCTTDTQSTGQFTFGSSKQGVYELSVFFQGQVVKSLVIADGVSRETDSHNPPPYRAARAACMLDPQTHNNTLVTYNQSAVNGTPTFAQTYHSTAGGMDSVNYLVNPDSPWDSTGWKRVGALNCVKTANP
jgi:hypothetical protein